MIPALIGLSVAMTAFILVGMHLPQPINYVRRDTIMPELASELREGLETLARAICAASVSKHATNVADHAEKAAVLWVHVQSDFREGKVSPQTTAWLAALFKIDPKTMGRQKPR